MGWQKGRPHSSRSSKENGSFDAVEMCEKMMEKAYECIENFPRFYQLSLGREIQSTIGRIFRNLFHCVNRFRKPPYALLPFFEAVTVEIDFLKRQVRSAFKNRCLSLKAYEDWSQLNNHVGRMTGAWHKRVRDLAEAQASLAQENPHPRAFSGR